MSNVRKFTAVGAGPIVATEAPEWIRKMSDHYVRTGAVRPSDAGRLTLVLPEGTRLSETLSPGRNDGSEHCDEG